MTQKIVLYADDDQDDRAWIEEAWQKMAGRYQIVFAETGREVVDYLEKPPHVQPALVVLDLNMPGMDGRQTLQRIKATPQLRHLPVAIVTTSASKMDRQVCSRLGASLFLTKPDLHAGWSDVVHQLSALVN